MDAFVASYDALRARAEADHAELSHVYHKLEVPRDPEPVTQISATPALADQLWHEVTRAWKPASLAEAGPDKDRTMTLREDRDAEQPLCPNEWNTYTSED